MRLESSYIKTTALGATPAGYKWKDGKCINTLTGAPYPGDQKLSNCYALYGPYKEPTGKTAVFSFLKKTFFGEDVPQGQPLPQASITASSLLVPAVVVVGGVALLLILRKKK